jgi:hypothetical protein
VAITSNHESLQEIRELYVGSGFDIATWHFSRDRSTPEGGWLPVLDSWQAATIAGLPPVSSNEPIGPGSSVNTENNPIKLVMAAAFAYTAKLPMYVFHSRAGVRHDVLFEDMAGVRDYMNLFSILPPDLANWARNDGKEGSAPFTAYAGGQADQLSAIENLTGSPGDDTIVGDGGPNVLRGDGGADTLVGGPGDDTLDGQAGVDTIDFTSAPFAVTIILAGRTAVGDGADTLSEIENAIGSP